MTILTKYPPVAGTFIRKIAASILTPSAASPFNPDAFSPAMNALFDLGKTLEENGFWRSTFYQCQPPYPTSGGPFVNANNYYLSGNLILSGGGSNVNFNSARTYTRGPSGIYAVTVSAAQWLMPTNGSYEQGTDVTTGSPIVWIMNVPPNSTVTKVKLWVDPPAGHGGVLPNTPPAFAAYIVNPNAGTWGLIASSTTSDPTAIGTYEDPHYFESSALTGAVGDGEFVVVSATGEYGGSALPGLKVFNPCMTFTRTKLGEE